MSRRNFSCLIALTILAWMAPAVAGYKRINKPNPADPSNVEIYQLDNGLRVYLTENHEKPEFYAELVVRAGYKHDPPETTGLAHYLEHLLFKGTQQMGTIDWQKEKVHIDRIEEFYEQRFRESDPEKRDAIYAKINVESQQASQYAIPNEVDRLYQSMGTTYVNAHTWFEETVYKVGLPSNRLEQWAAIESERYQNPVYRLFQPELEIVYEEKNRAMDNKDRIINEILDRAVFKVHPYGQQTGLGSVEHLKNPSLKNIHDFFNRYYVPGNMALMLSGDIKAGNAIEIIDRYFSVWEKKPVPKSPTWDEPALEGVERVEATYEGEEKVLIAFRTVPINHPDAPALTIADEILDNSHAGLMNQLVQRQEVRAASAHRMLMNDHGVEQLEGIPKADQTLEEIEKLLLDQVDRLKAGDFADNLITAIVNNQKKKQKAEMEGNNTRVARMRNSFVRFEEWDQTITELDRLADVTKDDVVRVANRYFRDDYVVAYRKDAPHEVPKIDKPKIDAIDIDATRQSDFAARISTMSAREISPDFVDASDYEIVDYAPSTRLFYAKNPVNDLFLFEIRVDFGFNQDNRIQFAQKLLNVSGTGDLNSEQVKTEWFNLATGFSFNAGNDESSYSISGLDENFVASLDLMMRIIKQPKASQETLNEMINIVLADREDSKKDPRSIRSALAHFNRHGQQSRWLRQLSNEAITHFTVDDLHTLARGLLDYQQTIYYAGSLPIEAVISELKKKHSITSELKTPPPFLNLTIFSPDSHLLRIFHKEMAQAQVYVEYGGEVFNEATVPSAQLFREYFSGGMSGLVFQEIREARALAYSAYAGYELGSRTGVQNMAWGGMGTQADKTAEAIEAYLELHDQMPVTPERFDAAKAALVNTYKTGKTGFREVLDTVRSWERLGLQPDPRKQRFEAIKQADLETLTRFHSHHIKGRPRLISIVGDTSKIDVARLTKIAQPEFVALEEIFAF